MSLSFTLLSSFVLKNKLYSRFADKFINNYFYERLDIKANDEFNLFKPQIHKITSLDGQECISYEFKNNILNNYIFLILNVDYSINDSLNYIKGFGEYGYNFVLIPSRSLPTYGINESYDLIEWINYYYNLNNDISITLLGEKIGANTIIKTLKFEIPACVKCSILDQPTTNLKDKLLREFTIDKNINNDYLLEKSIDSKLRDKYNIALNELNINNCLKHNEVPLCFVYNKSNTENNYFDFLKIYNENKSVNKIFFTNLIDRNFKDENYFEVLNLYIINN